MTSRYGGNALASQPQSKGYLSFNILYIFSFFITHAPIQYFILLYQPAVECNVTIYCQYDTSETKYVSSLMTKYFLLVQLVVQAPEVVLTKKCLLQLPAGRSPSTQRISQLSLT